MQNLTIWQAVAFATELGIAFATAVLLGLLIGHVADDRLGHEFPFLTMLGAFLGLAAGVYSSAQMAQYFVGRKKE